MDIIIDLFELVAALVIFILFVIVVFGVMPFLFKLLFNMISYHITLRKLKRLAQSQGIDMEDLDADTLGISEMEVLLIHELDRRHHKG